MTDDKQQFLKVLLQLRKDAVRLADQAWNDAGALVGDLSSPEGLLWEEVDDLLSDVEGLLRGNH